MKKSDLPAGSTYANKYNPNEVLNQ